VECEDCRMGFYSADCGAKENVSIVLWDLTGNSVGVVDLILHASAAFFPISSF
jgi:kynureninase